VDLVLRDAGGVEVLVAEECLELLATSSLGRIAVTIGAVPAIFPVQYQMVEGQIVFRAGKGTNLHTASANTVVARDVRDGADVDSVLKHAAHLWDPEIGGCVIAILPGFLSGRRFTRAA
jgi:hypothetical protein